MTEQEEKNPAASKSIWRIAFIAAWVFVALVAFSMGFFPLRSSHDEWWHLKTGKYIVDNDYHLPEKDVFTYTAQDYEWHNHEWLTQVLMYKIWQGGEAVNFGGWRFIILLKALLLVATWLLLARFLYDRAGRGWRGLLIAFFLAVLTIAVSRRMFWPRPPVVTNIFFIFFLYVLWLYRVRRIRAWHLVVLPLLMPLWANLHGGFLLGGIAVAAYAAGAFIALLYARYIKHDKQSTLAAFENLIAYGVTGFLCGIGSLLNPYTYQVYLLSGRVMKSKELVKTLGELMPPDFHFTWAYAFLIAIIATGLLVLITHVLLRKKTDCPPVADLLLVAFFFQQSFLHVRHLILFGIAAAPLAAWLLTRLWGWLGNRGRKLFAVSLVAVGLWIGLWIVFLPGEAIGLYRAYKTDKLDQYFAVAESQFDKNRQLAEGMEMEPGSYPIEAAEFILEARPPGRMYNRNNLSGYLIWALSPEHYKVFTDSRFDIFGQDFLADELSIAEGGTTETLKAYYTRGKNVIPGLRPWKEVVEEWNINWIFLDKGEGLNWHLLQPDADWALIYSDQNYRIYIKRTEANRPWIDKYESDFRTRRVLEMFKQEKARQGIEL